MRFLKIALLFCCPVFMISCDEKFPLEEEDVIPKINEYVFDIYKFQKSYIHEGNVTNDDPVFISDSLVNVRIEDDYVLYFNEDSSKKYTSTEDTINFKDWFFNGGVIVRFLSNRDTMIVEHRSGIGNQIISRHYGKRM